MKKCVCCQKFLTDDMQKSEVSYNFAYAVDLQDFYCEKCDAHKRAASCATIINSLLSNYRKKSNEIGIKDAKAYINKKLYELKSYWTKYYLDFLNESDKKKYEFWLKEFNSYMNSYNFEFSNIEKIENSARNRSNLI